jgi:hypothetical protein
LREGQALVAVDEEFLVALRHEEHRQIVAQAVGRRLERRIVGAAHFRRDQFELAAGRGQRRNGFVEQDVGFEGHFSTPSVWRGGRR